MILFDQIKRYTSKLENVTESLLNAFNYCIIGRWIYLDYKDSDGQRKEKTPRLQSIVAKNIFISDIDFNNFITIYEYLRIQSDCNTNLNFSYEDASLNESSLIDSNSSKTDLCKLLDNIKL